MDLRHSVQHTNPIMSRPLPASGAAIPAHACTSRLKALPYTNNEHLDAEWLLGELAFKNIEGFFVQLATPVPDSFRGNAYAFSWGYYQTECFYFDKVERIPAKAASWAETVITEAKKKAQAKVAPASPSTS